LLIVLIALAADALIGDPDWLWRRLPHPVVLIGAQIDWLDRHLNRDAWPAARRKAAGIVALGVLIVTAGVIGAVLQWLLLGSLIGSLLLGVLASVLIAQRSLYQHVARVRDAFASGGLESARSAVTMIVGRDPAQLDRAGVSRAAIESSAENFSDGIVAPVFWLALLGLPGLLIYKAVNTADSMIGHRNARFESFGWASARFDDLLNLAPARLSGVLLALAAPLLGQSVGLDLDGLWRAEQRGIVPAGAALAWWLVATAGFAGGYFTASLMRSAAAGEMPPRLRNFLVAVGVLLLAAAGRAASAPSAVPTASAVLAGLAALVIGALLAFCGVHFALRKA